MPRLRTLTATLATSVLLLAGCGGGGEPAPTDQPTSATSTEPATPQEAAAASVERMFTSRDAQDCTTLYTAAALEQMVGTEDPVAACRTLLPTTSPARSLQVEGPELSGERATARVTPDGGDYSGLAVHVELVQVDGSWQVDRISDLELLDKQDVLSPIHDGLYESVGNSLRPEDLECIDSLVGAIPDEEVEQLLLERQMGQRGVDALRQCLGAGQDMLAMFAMLNNQLLHAGVSEDDAACVAGYMTDFFKDWTIEEVLADPDTYGQQRDARIVEVTKRFCLD